MKTRDQILELASLREFDLVIIGAGIVGAGIAQDAACRGLSVVLIDKDDFASGTSSRTTKLIHGGLRYLEQLQFKLTSELCRERALLEFLAPHLVRDFSFVLPLTKGHPLLQIKATVGLTVYDLLSFMAGHSEPHKRISRKEVLESAPALADSRIVGGLRFHDAITDDARLVIEVIKSACANGAHAINYMEATGFGVDAGARINKVECRDRYSGKKIVLRCKACVNATGVWSDHVTRLIDTRWGSRVLPSKGVHIVVPQSAFETNTALFLPAPDKRYVFVVPWQRALMIGPTDTFYKDDINNPMANEDEVDYLLSVVNGYNGQRRLNRSDVISTWAGLRPLAGAGDPALKHEKFASRNGNSEHASTVTGNVSREHEIFEGPGGMIGVVGGKLTNYRIMANQVMEKVLGQFPQLAMVDARTSRTKRIMLGGWMDKQDFLTSTAAISTKARKLSVEPATIDHLIASYGKDAQSVLEIIEKDPSLNERICPDFPPIMAEVPYCVAKEMAVSLEDLLARRVRLAQLNHRQCLEAAPKVTRLMQQMLGWDDTRVAAELSALQFSVGRVPWQQDPVLY